MSLENTLTKRPETHGSFFENSEISQAIKAALRSHSNYKKLSPQAAESLDMIAHKLGRIIAGDANFADHWHDIAGYATLVERLL